MSSSRSTDQSHQMEQTPKGPIEEVLAIRDDLRLSKNKKLEENNKELENHFDGLRHELKLISDLLPTFFKHGGNVTDWIKSLREDTSKVMELDTVEAIKSKLLEIGKRLAKLKEDIQSTYAPPSADRGTGKEGDAGGEVEKRLVKKYSVFTWLEKEYNVLDLRCKLCLLCLAFFPENVVIKKRLLVYWWVGEGLVEFTKSNTSEEVAEEVISVLVEKGFVQVVDKMSGLEIDSYRVHPLVRAGLIARARETKFFDFDDHGNPTSVLKSECCKACLVDDGRIPQDRKPDFLQTYLVEGEEEPTEKQKPILDDKLRRLQALFNLDRQFLDLQAKLLATMKNLNILHLGRWQNASRHHIEMENSSFLEGLKYTKYLKFVGLQGISQIRVLPGIICRLPFLLVLDLRACHNLQELPEDIGLLKRLTHLDISECYLLDGLPRGVKYLTELQVFKGFVIGDNKDEKFCNIQDLEGFKKLRKLTIHTSNDNFPGKEELEAFQKFEGLQKLSIVWGRGTLSSKEEKEAQQKGDASDARPPVRFPSPLRCGKRNARKQDDRKAAAAAKFKFPRNLAKLDLQCYPHAESPDWLIPEKLTRLTKLYIRGGEMKTLRESEKWENVEILLLKFLSGFMLEWDQLREKFPKLVYLEKVNCPRLTFYPCDERGTWKKDATMEEELLEEFKSKRKSRV